MVKATKERNGYTVQEICVDITTKWDKLNLPEIPGYELVVHEVRKYATHFQWGNHIVDLFGWTYILMDDVAYDVVHL